MTDHRPPEPHDRALADRRQPATADSAPCSPPPERFAAGRRVRCWPSGCGSPSRRCPGQPDARSRRPPAGRAVRGLRRRSDSCAAARTAPGRRSCSSTAGADGGCSSVRASGPLTAAGYRVVTYDALSHGASDPGPSGARRSSVIEFLAALEAVAAATRPAGRRGGPLARRDGRGRGDPGRARRSATRSSSRRHSTRLHFTTYLGELLGFGPRVRAPAGRPGGAPGRRTARRLRRRGGGPVGPDATTARRARPRRRAHAVRRAASRSPRPGRARR